jgi:outer membrane protein
MRLGVCCLAVFCLMVPTGACAETETLEQAWALAYRINPSLQAERAKLRATDEEVSQALSHWRPSIDATANVGKTYQYVPAQAVFGTADFADTTRGYGVQVTQPLFRGLRTDSETEAAENQVLSGRAKLDDAEQQLFLDTATAFLDIVRDQAVLDSDRDNENVLEQKLKETRVRAQAGDLTQTDVRQAESRLARAHVARYQAESSLTTDRASYERLVGKMPEKLTAPDLRLTDPEQLDDVLHLAETRNPKVIAARYDIDEAKAEVDLNKGSLLPEINLVGSSTRNWGQNITIPGREDSSQILIQATMPLYRAGTDYSKSRAAEQTVTQRRMELEEARHKAIEAANNSWQGFETAQAALEADKDEVEAAREALKGVREESKVGTRTTLDVLNAEQELLDAKIDLAKSSHDRDLAIIQIKAAIGELTVASLKLPGSVYDPKRHYDDVRNQWIGFSEDDDRYMAAPEKQDTRETPP